MDDIAAVARLLETLRPWLGQLVIIGGWAHRLHREHPLANPPAYLPVRTTDADIAFSLSAPPEGDIRAALRSAGFTEDLLGENTPPVTHYHLGQKGAGFYAEFLVPLYGSGRKRVGTKDATVAQAGVIAQKLRHVDLLLEHPWRVRLGIENGFRIELPLDVLLPNPVSFIVQKLLIRAKRDFDKQAQDALYIHDTLELFARVLDVLRRTWVEQLRPDLSQRMVGRIDRLWRDQFGTENDVLRAAARIPQDRVLSADRLRAACEYGLEQVLGNRDT